MKRKTLNATPTTNENLIYAHRIKQQNSLNLGNLPRKDIINYERSGSQGNNSFKNSVRRLSSKKRLKEIDKNSWLILKSGIKLTQFYGIEIDDYAHETAKLSLWMAEHQMNLAFDEIIGDAKPTLPLSPSANIVNKNSLKLDWKKFVSQNSDGIIYIIGNPPYIGSSKQTTNNKSDMSLVLGNLKSYKNLDYISCWFYLAARFISNTGNKFSFVLKSVLCL